MIEFKVNLGKWLSIAGQNLKGRDLAITLLFLAFIVVVVTVAFSAISLPKVQVLF